MHVSSSQTGTIFYLRATKLSEAIADVQPAQLQRIAQGVYVRALRAVSPGTRRTITQPGDKKGTQPAGCEFPAQTDRLGPARTDSDRQPRTPRRIPRARTASARPARPMMRMVSPQHHHRTGRRLPGGGRGDRRLPAHSQKPVGLAWRLRRHESEGGLQRRRLLSPGLDLGAQGDLHPPRPPDPLRIPHPRQSHEPGRSPLYAK